MSKTRQTVRRKDPRVNEPLDILVFWRGESGRHEAFICDVSEGGCYLNTAVKAEMDEQVIIEIPKVGGDVGSLDFHASIVSQTRTHIGFGAKFSTLTDEQRSLLSSLIVASSEADDRKAAAA